jgi:hypothetical protein
MYIIESGRVHQTSWLDDDQTIIRLEVSGKWSWQDAVEVVMRVNTIIAATSHDLYTIIQFRNRGFLPEAGSIGPLRRLIDVNNPNEKLIILINAGDFITKLCALISKTYGLMAIFGKFRFVQTLDEALTLIATHKREQLNPP